MTQFNDQKLISMASAVYYSPIGENHSHLENLLSKTKLTEGERNQLLDLVDLGKTNRPLSIRDMKNEIFSKIKFKTNNAYTTTVSRGELEAIYLFIKGLK